MQGNNMKVITFFKKVKTYDLSEIYQIAGGWKLPWLQAYKVYEGQRIKE